MKARTNPWTKTLLCPLRGEWTHVYWTSGKLDNSTLMPTRGWRTQQAECCCCTGCLKYIHKPSVPLQPIVSFVSSPTNELLEVPSRSACPSRGLDQLPCKELPSLFLSSSGHKPFPRNPGVFWRGVAVHLHSNKSCDTRLLTGSWRVMPFYPKGPALVWMTSQISCHSVWMQTSCPFEGTCTNLVMEDIKDRALSTFHPPSHFWKRYVDELCSSSPGPDLAFPGPSEPYWAVFAVYSGGRVGW